MTPGHETKLHAAKISRYLKTGTEKFPFPKKQYIYAIMLTIMGDCSLMCVYAISFAKKGFDKSLPISQISSSYQNPS